MNAQLGKVIALNGYPLSVVVALILHTVLLVSLLYLQSVSQTPEFELVQPTVIKALFFDENPQVLSKRKAERTRDEEDRRQRHCVDHPITDAGDDFEERTFPGRACGHGFGVSDK